MRRFLMTVCTAAILVAAPATAAADITAFVGISPTPESRAVRGFALGFGVLFLGFEFEYANVVEDELEALPSLKTGSGNVLVQTPIEVAGVQLYGTIGAGGYREHLLTHLDRAGGVHAHQLSGD